MTVDSKQTGSDVIEPLEFLLFDVVVTDALSADDTLTDGGQFSEQHLEDWRRKRLLKDLQELLWLTTHGNRIRQVIHALLIVSLCQQLLPELNLLEEELLNGFSVFQVW